MDACISKKISVFKWLLTLGMVGYHARWTYGYSITYISQYDEWLLDMYVNWIIQL